MSERFVDPFAKQPQAQAVQVSKVTRYLQFGWTVPPVPTDQNGSGSRVVVFVLPNGEALEMVFDPVAFLRFRADVGGGTP